MNGQEAKRSFKAGDLIMKQGEEGSCAYIIEEGLVEILIERPDGKIQQVGTRGTGTIVGEMAIVDQAPRSATVKALRDCKMLEISQEDYALRLKSTDPVVQMITRVMLMRFRDTLTRAETLGDSQGAWPPEAMEIGLAAHTDVMESVKIANDFREALENRQLTLHYQPIVDLETGQVVGFEALMRWTHPVQGVISPGIFIPIAEKSDLIVDASKWALEEACVALKRIETAIRPSSPQLYMSVNFSSHDFAEADFVSNMLDTVRRTGVDRSQIKLEITERVLIQQPANAMEALHSCRNAGIGIFIDDFGTGWSSLGYLHHYPIDTLKVDQIFTRLMQKEARSLGLVRSIIGIGKNLNMTVVTEGVESVEEVRLLRGMGCETAQGYYFARPMPESAVIDTLNNWNPARIAV